MICKKAKYYLSHKSRDIMDSSNRVKLKFLGVLGSLNAVKSMICYVFTGGVTYIFFVYTFRQILTDPTA